MKKYIKDYMKFHDIGEQDIIYCEARGEGCTNLAVDLHHRILRSQGGTDEPSNLILVCRNCHELFHAKKL